MKLRKTFAVLLIMIIAAAGSAFAGGSSEDSKAVSDSGRPVLRVAMECGYAPYNWTQTTDANGAVPIADSNDYAYGYDLEIVKLDWDSLVPAVQSGVVDCVIAGQSITSERLQMVDFTEPYYYASIICLVNEGSEYENAQGVSDLAGAVCTSQMNTIWYDVRHAYRTGGSCRIPEHEAS